MDNFNVFDDISNLPSLNNDCFDQFFETDANEIDFLINEALSGLQDLDVPSGFAVANNDANNDQPSFSTSSSRTATAYHSAQKSRSKSRSNTHARHKSGTAIFGFADHNRELSINGLSSFSRPILDQSHLTTKKTSDVNSIAPGELLQNHSTKAYNLNSSPIAELQKNPQQQQQQQQNQNYHRQTRQDMPSQEILNFNFEEKPTLLIEEQENEEDDDSDEEDTGKFRQRAIQLSPIKRITTPNTKGPQQNSTTQPRTVKQDDYIVTNQNPVSYKFPPSPTPQRLESQNKKIANSYSAKYLQSLQQELNQLPKLPFQYVDDFEPLLEEENPIGNNNNNNINNNNSNDLTFVPLPIQEPVYSKTLVASPPPLPEPQQQQQQQQQQKLY